MIYRFIFLISAALSLHSCIGDDIIDDFVEPELRLVDFIDTLGLGDVYQLDAQFFNNVGELEETDITWSSTAPTVVAVASDGQVFGASVGKATVSLSAMYEDTLLVTTSHDLVVSGETVETPNIRNGTLKTTSSYKLEGDFNLAANGSKLVLTLADNFITSDVLPGLFVYLSNNPNTINGALEISEVTVFEGVHSFDIPGDDVGINDYSHVLYFCKPFNVKVGDGPFDN